MYRLHYHVSNNGDGSASVRFHKTNKAAEKADESQSEGWGEPSAGHLDLEIQDGKIVRKELEWDREAKKYNAVYIPLQNMAQ